MKLDGTNIVDISNDDASLLESFINSYFHGGFLPNPIISFMHDWIVNAEELNGEKHSYQVMAFCATASFALFKREKLKNESRII